MAISATFQNLKCCHFLQNIRCIFLESTLLRLWHFEFESQNRPLLSIFPYYRLQQNYDFYRFKNVIF